MFDDVLDNGFGFEVEEEEDLCEEDAEELYAEMWHNERYHLF